MSHHVCYFLLIRKKARFHLTSCRYGGGRPTGARLVKDGQDAKCPQVSPPHEATPCEPSSEHACSVPPPQPHPLAGGMRAWLRVPRPPPTPFSRASLLRDLLQSYCSKHQTRPTPTFLPPATIPQTEEPGGLQSTGKQRTEQD